MTSLTDEQRQLVIETARNIAAARAILNALIGMDGIDASAALLTALTSMIEGSYAPEHRLDILNGLLAPTILQWAAEAAKAGGKVQ